MARLSHSSIFLKQTILTQLLICPFKNKKYICFLLVGYNVGGTYNEGGTHNVVVPYSELHHTEEMFTWQAADVAIATNEAACAGEMSLR